MERQWHNVVIENDEGDDGFHKAAPLLVQALWIIESVKTLTAAVQLSHRTNELFSRLKQNPSTSCNRLSTLFSGKTFRSIERLREKRKILYPVLDAILAAFVQVQHCDSVLSTLFPAEVSSRVVGTNSNAREESVLASQPEKDHTTENQGESARFPSDPFGDTLPNETLSYPARRAHKSLTVCHKNGLIGPRQMLLDGALFSQSTLDYANFRECFERLNTIAADPKLFTACEPRLRVLKSRYALHSAYNGLREDQCDPVMGGGSVARAPKVDIRRLETCISARTLLKFIESICRSDPSYPVSRLPSVGNTVCIQGNKGLSADEQQQSTFSHAKSDGGLHKPDWGSDRSEKSHTNKTHMKGRDLGKRNRAAEGAITVQDLVMRFWSAEGNEEGFPLHNGQCATAIASDKVAHALTPERLFLTPQYAQVIGGLWSNLHHTENGKKKISSQAQHVHENLRNFLSIHNANQGDLFAKLVVPALSHLLHTSGNESDAIELEVTVNGRVSGELDRIADWCVESGILEENRICFSIHATHEDTFAAPNKDAAHRTGEPAPWWWLMCQEHLSRTARGNLTGQAETFQDVLQNIFEPIWEALLDPESHPNLVHFLRRLSSFSISLGCTPAVLQELPVASSPSQYTLHSVDGSPSNVFFAFHIQRNVQLLNCFNCAHEYFYRMRDVHQAPAHSTGEGGKRGNSVYGDENGDYDTCEDTASSPYNFNFWNEATGEYDNDFTRSHHLPLHTLYHHHAPIIPGPLRLRLHSSDSSNSRTMLTESILGLLIADEVVNPTQAFEWGPLTYLYYLTQRHLVLTPSSNQHSSSTIRKTLSDNAISLGVRVGLHLSLATVSPLFFHNTDEALNEELLDARKHLGLATTDVTEMCLRSIESRMPYACEKRSVVGGSGATEGNAGVQKCLREALFGEAWPRAEARQNNFPLTQVSSLRLNFRDAALRHEMDLLCRKGLRDAHLGPSFEVPSMSSPSRTQTPEQISVASFLDHTLLYTHESQLTTQRNRLYTFYNVPSSPSLSAEGGEWKGDRKGSTTLKDSGSKWRREHLEETLRFPRIMIIGPKNESPSATAKMIVHAMALRQNYQQYAVKPLLSFYKKRADKRADGEDAGGDLSLRNADATENVGVNAIASLQFNSYEIRDGVIDVVFPAENSSWSTHKKKPSQKNTTDTFYDMHPYVPLPTWATFHQHAREIRALSSDPSVQDFCLKRLGMLECKYNLHIALTKDDEEAYFVQVPLGEYEDAISPTSDLPSGSNLSRKIAISNTAYNRAATNEKGVAHSQSRPYKLVPRRDPKADVFNVVKVDVHCHMAGGFTAKSLLLFIKRKIQFNGDDVVGVDTNTRRSITLREMFRKVIQKRHDLFPAGNNQVKRTSQPYVHSTSVNEITLEEQFPKEIETLTIAALDVQAGKSTFNRFDEFNSRYSPMRVSELRSLLLKTDNFMGGRYFAELIRNEVFDKNEKEGKVFTENRLSIYGRDHGEWMRLANWFVIQGMAHHTNRWMIQVPRLFSLYRLSGVLRNFEEMLWNIFDPLWEASLHPEKHPLLDYLLQHISGFDSVDNESSLESGDMVFLPPAQWTRAENPPFTYYMYYMWANITTLNRFRASRGLSTFDFRPHAGESGDPDHMADVFLLANGIGHGINLVKRPVLRYLYYLSQIPLAIVPLSNNALFCKYSDNPFPTFFRQGLNVSLGTDGALMFHNTEQPLLEEYTTAQNVWSLSAADVCEIAKRSVLMSGFSPKKKAQWLGDQFFLQSVVGNDVAKSHLPMTRCALRYEVYMDEISYLEARAAMDVVNKAMFTPAEEDLILMDTIGYSRVEVLRRNIWGFPTSVHHQTCEQSKEPEKNLEDNQSRTLGTASSRESFRSSRCTNGTSSLAQSQL